MSTTSFRAAAVCVTALFLAVGCHKNFEWFDEAESALGRPTGHDSVGAAMVPYKGQRTCPVSGEKLGSAGSPVPLKIKGDLIYVCCSTCVEKAKGDADACVARVKAERSRYAALKPIIPDLGPYGGQKICPSCGHELEADGSSRDLVIKGERIHVCGNSCANRARGNFGKYLPKVKAEREAALAAAMAKAPLPSEDAPADANVRPAATEAQSAPVPGQEPDTTPAPGNGGNP